MPVAIFFIIFIVSGLVSVFPAQATLTSNSQSKSQMPDEVELNISIQTATAISAVAELVKTIEEADALDVGSEILDEAIRALDNLVLTLGANLDAASTTPLLIGEIVLPEEVVVDASDLEQSATALQDAIRFVNTNVDGTITDRALAEFLLREAQRAQRALNLVRVAAQGRNADLMRLAILRFDRFTHAAISYSVVWSLVPAP